MTEIAIEIENDRSLKLHQTWQVAGLSSLVFRIDCAEPTTNEGHLIHQSVSGWGRSGQRGEGGWWRRQEAG